MVASSPWQKPTNSEDFSSASAVPQHASSAMRWRALSNFSGLGGPPVFLRGRWSSICAAAGCIIIVILLFEPWITVNGWDGKAQVDGFGQISATTEYLNLWSQHGAPIPSIGGTWAILICINAVIVVCTVILSIFNPAPILKRVGATCTVVVAILVCLTADHTYSKGPEVKDMIGHASDLGGQIGLLMQGAFGGEWILPGLHTDRWGTARLTPWAILAIAVAVVSAMTVLSGWITRRPSRMPHPRSSPTGTAGE
jgi:hypothetical protein